ncbi:hypothetical protein HXX76_006033 [Chlamydomonas incerta]|uniref:Uncharacterized protein n=1 Tax=Chlamydomonas incerta TaxID=51695 RepID=A0A835W6F1_CHLIN|nr:hypothetical protein HXX76_006033 [Chlamydomonas incerta]|eukprot:KAG2437381.1 hypothetical protein HXX76_006033 [Chlamydomonas incerta]
MPRAQGSALRVAVAAAADGGNGTRLRTSTAKRTWLAPLSVLVVAVAVGTLGLQPAQALHDVGLSWTKMDPTYNPSLVIQGDRFLSALKRTTFRKTKGKTFWVNHLYMCIGELDDLSRLRCQSYNPWREPYLECEFGTNVRDGKTDTTGLGDVKVWVWPGRGSYAIFGRKPQKAPGAGPYCGGPVVYDQWIAMIRPEAHVGEWRLQQPLRLFIDSGYSYPKDAKWIMEKNWMPWPYKDAATGREALHVTHMVDPHRVLECAPSGACKVAHETPGAPALFSKFAGHSIHGGPPVIWVDAKLARDGKPCYMGIMHHIEMLSPVSRQGKPKKKMKLYRHFAYKFQPEPPFAITAISDELPLTFYRHEHHPTKAHVTYVAGFFMSANGTVYISYGSGDRQGRVLVMSLGELEATFTGNIAFLP